MTISVTKKALNVREKLAELDKPTGIAGEAMLRAETPQEQFNLIGAGRRNILINGDFQVSQRGDYSSATSASHNGYTVDRVQTTSVGVNSTIQHQSVTLPNGWETKSVKVAATGSASSGAYIGLSQNIEDGKQVLRSGATWTASAWLKTNRSDVVFRLGGVKNIGDPVIADGEWHYHTATFSYDTTGSGTQGIMVITYDNNATSISSGDYIEIAQFQLELGKVATPFEHRSYGEELALCQRYFVKLQGDGTDLYTIYGSGVVAGSSTVLIHGTLPVSMRDVPDTLAFSNVQIYDGATVKSVVSVAAIRSSTISWSADLTTATGLTAANPAILRGNASASSYITASAEL